MLKRSIATGALVGLLGAGCSSAPPYSGWTPEQLYEHGQRAFEDGDWREARRAFERLVLQFPLYEHAVDARYHMARSHHESRDYISAIAEFTRIVQVYPDHALAADAWMGLCGSHAAMSPHPQRDQRSTLQALSTCRNVAEDFNGAPIGDSAAALAHEMQNDLAERTYGEGDFYYRRRILESAEQYFLKLVSLYPNSDSAPRAMARLVDIYERWGWDEQREDFRTRLLQTFPDSPEARAVDVPAVRDTLSSIRSRAPPVH